MTRRPVKVRADLEFHRRWAPTRSAKDALSDQCLGARSHSRLERKPNCGCGISPPPQRYFSQPQAEFSPASRLRRNRLKQILRNRDRTPRNGISNAPLNSHGVAVNKRNISVVGAFFLFLVLALPTCAQVTVGDNLSMNLNGNLAFGYTGDYGNEMQSSHGLTFGGSGDLSGSYYNPNFLSFHIQPFYNQSRANSNYQSISDASGLNTTAAIFSGSNFPGSVSYSKSYNGEGNFGVPGIPNYTSHGDSGVFSVGWGINIPDLPHFAVSFQDGSNEYSIYGTNTNSSSRYDSFALNSSYMLAGFNLNAGYRYVNTSAQIPELVSGQAPEESNSSGNSFFGSLAHRLPWNGAFSAGASRSDTSAEFLGGSYSGTIDLLNAGLGFAPFANFNFGTTAQYNDNLAGSLYSAVITAGGGVETTSQQTSHALDVTSYAVYRVPSIHVVFTGTVEDREQSIFGIHLTDHSITGSASYSNSLLGGVVNATTAVTENLFGNATALGLLSSVNYARRLFGWNVTGGFNYSQNQHSILITYSTSGYGYNGTIGRKFGYDSYFAVSATGSKIGLTGDSGTTSFLQSYSSQLKLRGWVTFSGSYSKSSGNSILTSSGLVPTPIPAPILSPSSLVLYGGHAYSFGIGSSPLRRLTLSASYAHALSETVSPYLTSNNRTDMLVSQVNYQFRQMHFLGGYTRLVQGFSMVGGPPAMVGSFYVGVTRWFDFF